MRIVHTRNDMERQGIETKQAVSVFEMNWRCTDLNCSEMDKKSVDLKKKRIFYTL